MAVWVAVGNGGKTDRNRNKRVKNGGFLQIHDKNWEGFGFDSKKSLKLEVGKVGRNTEY